MWRTRPCRRGGRKIFVARPLALVSGILDPQPVAVKPVRRSWGPELAVRELRRELEVTLGARTVGASEVSRLFRSIGDDFPGFDVTASAGRVDLRRDGRTITLAWLDEEDHVALTVRSGGHARTRTYAWSREITTFVDGEGDELLGAFRAALLDFAQPTRDGPTSGVRPFD